MKVTWLESLKSMEIALDQSFFRELKQPKVITVRFGSLKKELEIVVHRDFPEQTIGLPLDFSGEYTIPKNLPYEGLIKENEIHIGPLIAYISMGRWDDLKNRVYISTLPRYLDYENIKGLIFVCNKHSIFVEWDTIEGFYFDPYEEDPEQVWKYGKFPLPDAIFNRSFVAQETVAALEKKIGRTIFNSYWYNLDKLATWEFLSKDPYLKRHLPYTEKLEDPKRVEELLGEHGTVYLKPSGKSQGRGLIKGSKAGKGFFLVDFKMRKFYLKDYESLAKFLGKLTIPYIIQQAVHYKANNRHIDFRLVLQKDASKEWCCSGLVARIGYEGSIITNSRGRETSIPGRKALTTIFNVSEEKAKIIEREMSEMVIRAAKMYEREGMHLGDLAADMGVDANLNFWLFEIQLNYGVDGRSKVVPFELFQKIMTIPFKYAKALAGFKL